MHYRDPARFTSSHNHFSSLGPRILPSLEPGTHLNQHLASFLGYPPVAHKLFLTTWVMGLSLHLDLEFILNQHLMSFLGYLSLFHKSFIAS
ncbi:hypothetical protein Csa_009678 [Cucumis sativus]|uniref:Uncharacterized protein n=1 Tax=Cucumis sativus TaxID=3659 RepID=A0A0A0LAI4_CUCSA|nr:hypothetical protein Csa_009678 [Cucumis sativus]